ncbi:MAG: bifunctional riboflavin kinase/FAD synthetase [Gammaproteobacteria bacterium]|nr:bifunctional riboflavin kinase/FAD synthetase [Gammaproteobacteria bacterium]
MELIRGLHNLRARHRGCVVTIGNFDGVHRGHRAVFEQLSGIASAQALPSLVMTFEPQPREFFSSANAPARLTRFREKMLALADTPIDRVLVVRFTREFSRLSPEEFIGEILVAGLDVRHVVVGDDFHFGHRASGTFSLLQELGEREGFEVGRCVTLEHRGRRVSSSWVRDALADGDLGLAAELLGRPYCMHGRVAHGRRLGRQIGFPTANIGLRRLSTPLSGVFAVRLHGVDDAPLAGMANLGTRPTVDGVERLLEVHLFDFAQDIYGREVSVEFVARLREEQRFASLDALKAQLSIDQAAARERLSA